MERILQDFCRTNDTHKCIQHLKTKLKFSEQCNEYDMIYQNYFQGLTVPHSNTNVIPGLARMAKFFVISFHYRKLLIKGDNLDCGFKAEYEEGDDEDEDNEILSERYLVKVYNSIRDDFSIISMYDFLTTVLGKYFSGIYVSEVEAVPCDKSYAIYFIFGNKACNLSYEKIVDGLFKPFPVFYVGCRYAHSHMKSPHNGMYNLPPDFLWHDVVHALTRCIHSITNKYYDDWKHLVNVDMVKNSFRHRCVYAMVWYWLFENDAPVDLEFSPEETLRGLKMAHCEDEDERETAYERGEHVCELIPDEAYEHSLDVSDQESLIDYIHMSTDIPEELSDRVRRMLAIKGEPTNMLRNLDILTEISREFTRLFV